MDGPVREHRYDATRTRRLVCAPLPTRLAQVCVQPLRAGADLVWAAPVRAPPTRLLSDRLAGRCVASSPAASLADKGPAYYDPHSSIRGRLAGCCRDHRSGSGQGITIALLDPHSVLFVRGLVGDLRSAPYRVGNRAHAGSPLPPTRCSGYCRGNQRRGKRHTALPQTNRLGA